MDSLINNITIQNFVGDEIFAHGFYVRNPTIVANYLVTNYKQKKLLFYGVGLHTHEVTALMQNKDNICGVVNEEISDENYAECEFSFDVFKKNEIQNLNFDYLVLLGNWNKENINKLSKELNIEKAKILLPYIQKQIQEDNINSILLQIKTNKPILVHLAWDAKNDILSEAAEEIAKEFYLIKFYLHDFYFENLNDIYFNNIFRLGKNGQKNNLIFLLEIFNRLKPEIIVATKPTANETIFNYLIMKNKPKESKFIFAPWGDILTYKASTLTDEEMMETCGCKTLKEFYFLRDCEKALIQESDSVMSSLLGVYKKEVLDKETKDLISTTFFMHPRYFVFKDKTLSDVPKLCYAGSIVCRNDDSKVWAMAMDHRKDYEKILKQNIALDIYTLSHGQHGCYNELKQKYTNFNFCANTSHWDLPKILQEYDFGLIWSNLTQECSDKLYPGPQSVFLAKAITYLAAGLPIIVPREAVLMADFVKTNNIGIVISIANIANLYELIQGYDYLNLKYNVKKLQNSRQDMSNLITTQLKSLLHD